MTDSDGNVYFIDPLTESFTGRVLGALKHDVATFEAIVCDERATGQAATVVGVVGLLSGVRLMIAAFGYEFVVLALILLITFTLVCLAWVLFTGIAILVGDVVLVGEHTDATFAGQLRVTGFASAPLVFALFFSTIPSLENTVLALITLLWSFVCVVIALRTALSTSTLRALAVGLITVMIAGPIMATIVLRVLPVRIVLD